MKSSGRIIVGFLMAGLLGCGTTATESKVSQAKVAEPSTPLKLVSGSPEPQIHEVRKEIAVVDETGIPQVFLTAEHSAMCRVRVGDPLPAIKLPKLSGGDAELSSLAGAEATVVVFWEKDPWMSATALKDIGRDITPSDDLAVVGIAVKGSEGDVQNMLKEAAATFPQLLDSDGKAFGKVGMSKMPRVYVLDASGNIVWFDIEYSESTHRELKRTLAVLTANK